MAEDIRAEMLDDFARNLFSALCDGDGEHSEALDLSIIKSRGEILLRDSLAQVTQDAQLVADVLAEYADELDKAACDRCEQCGPGVMCSFHSVLSALQRHTWTNGAIERDRLKRELSTLSASLAAAQAEITRLQGYQQHKWDCSAHVCRMCNEPRTSLSAHGYGKGNGHTFTAMTCSCGLDPAPLPNKRKEREARVDSQC